MKQICSVAQEAEAALNSLDKASLGELKSFGSPAFEVVQVLASVMVLAAPGGNIPKVRLSLQAVRIVYEWHWVQPNVCYVNEILHYSLYGNPNSKCSILICGTHLQDLSWNTGKKFMGNVDGFLKSLLNFDKDNIPEKCVEKVEKDYLSHPGFTPENIRSKSSAAAGLCAWVMNICKYFRIYQVNNAHFTVFVYDEVK